LIETYANTTWDRVFGGDPYIIICLDTDNSTATGSSFDNCDGQVGVSMDGIDRYIQVSGGPTLSIVIVDSAYSPIPGAVTSVATAGSITELSINNAALGLSAATCVGSFRGALYFDNQTTDPDDNVPDSGALIMNCGSPTAITLDSLQAQPTTSPILPVALIGVSAAALIGVVYLTRRGRRKTA
jgi:hypothetical protein